MRRAVIGSLLLCSFSSAGCYTMRPVAVDDLRAYRPTQVRVTRTDQAVVVVWGPQVVNDRLVGWVDGKYQVMPKADVRQVLMRQPARGRTAALVTAGALGAVALVYMVSSTGTYVDPCSMGSSECEPM